MLALSQREVTGPRELRRFVPADVTEVGRVLLAAYLAAPSTTRE
jgi:hypothetical protein